MGNQPSLPQQQHSSSCDVSEVTMDDDHPHFKPLVKQLSDCTTVSSVQELLSTPKKGSGPTIFDLVARHASPVAQKRRHVGAASKEVSNSMQDQASHNIHLICMVLAYARVLEQTRKQNAIFEPIAAKKVVAMGLTLELKPKSRRPYPADIWDTWKSVCHIPTFAEDLYIHTLELDAALKEFLYSIVISERTETAYVVLGSSDHRRLGQGMTDICFRDQTLGVDGYWGDHVLGQSFAQGLKRRLQYQLPLKAPKHVVLCGFGGGGALATILGVLLSPDIPSTQVWTYGAPKVGDTAFQQAHMTLETKSQLHHVRFVNRGDAIPNQPIVALDGWYCSVGVQVELPNSTKLENPHSIQAYLRRTQHWKCSLPLQQWYEQETTKRALRTKTNQRRIMLVTFLVIVYAPLLYLKWNKIVHKAERLTTANSAAKIFDCTSRNSRDVEDLSTFASLEPLDMEEDTSVNCLHCPGDPSEMIWPMDANDEEPEAIQRAAIAEEKANEERMAAANDAEEAEAGAIADANAEEERIVTAKAIEEGAVINEAINGEMSVDVKVHAVILEAVSEPEPVERATLVAQATGSEETTEDESVLEEVSDDAREGIQTAEVNTTSRDEGLFHDVESDTDLQVVQETVVERGDQATNDGPPRDESEMSNLEIGLEPSSGGDFSPSVSDTEEPMTVPEPPSMLAPYGLQDPLALSLIEHATPLRAVFKVMSFRPSHPMLLSSPTSQDVGASLVLARSELRRVQQVFSEWEHELFYRQYLKDDEKEVALAGWKRPEKYSNE